jgi:hypothetical protein
MISWSFLHLNLKEQIYLYELLEFVLWEAEHLRHPQYVTSCTSQAGEELLPSFICCMVNQQKIVFLNMIIS